MSSGHIFFVRQSYSLRYWTVKDGRRVRKCVSLGTADRALAQNRADRLLRGAAPDTATAPETFEVAARRVVAAQAIATAPERLSRLERWAFPAFGAMPVTAVRPSHIRQALARAVSDGRSRTTVQHLRDDVSTVFHALWQDELVSENWALRCEVPKGAKVDRRPRVVLTDDEFALFLDSPVVPEALKVMALVSRTLGGARTSELHALDWAQVDVSEWKTVRVYRPKTQTNTFLAIPAVLVKFMRDWWVAAGRPTRGPVFPDRWGERHGKRSWARELRAALWMAEVRRADRKQDDPLQVDTPDSRRVDWHSFRRAYNTGLAAAGVNVQQAMRLAGHSSAQTHMRYVALAEALEVPDGALPNGFGSKK